VQRGLDERLRGAMFAYLDELTRRQGDQVSYRDLEAFTFEGRPFSSSSECEGFGLSPASMLLSAS
jgi:hypothetical protein